MSILLRTARIRPMLGVKPPSTKALHNSTRCAPPSWAAIADSTESIQISSCVIPRSGPILHDKLFFFVDYLGSRYYTGGVLPATVLSAAMRNGDFSALLATANPIQL